MRMEWSDDGIVLAARRHGEAAAVVTLLTRRHGRHAGLVRGALGRRLRGVYQPGNEVAATWRARLEEHLGTFTCESLRCHAALLLDDAAPLAALSSACAVCEAALPEREPLARVFEGFLRLLEALHGEGWPATYAIWERNLLADLGFGLDLGACVVTGRKDDLAYVSPRTGRALSAAAGERYRDRLLRLPAFLIPEVRNEDRAGAVPGGGMVPGQAHHESELDRPDPGEVEQALKLTGYFLEKHLFAPHHRGVPAARTWLLDRVRVMSAISGVSSG